MATLLVLAGCGETREEDCPTAARTGGKSCEGTTPQPLDDHGDLPDDGATKLSSAGAVEEGTLSDPADVDVFTFVVEAGETYRILCEPGTLKTCSLRLLDEAGTEVWRTDSTPWSPAWGRIKEETQRRYYVEVSTQAYADSGTYTLRLVHESADDHANTPTGATVIQPSGTPFPVNAYFSNDVDYLTFRSEKDHGYLIACSHVRGANMQIRLLSEAGQELDSAIPMPVNTGWVSTLAPGEASWFLEVRVGALSEHTEVSCQLVDMGLDQHGGSISTATPVTPGVPVSVRMEARNDVDVVSFTSVAHHVYAVRLKRPLPMRLTDASGTQLLPVASEKLFFEAEDSGPYYLHFAAPVTTSPVELVIEDTGPDDHGDGPETATPFTVGTSISGLRQHENDTDAFTFMADGDGVYRVTCEPDCGWNLDFSSASGPVRRINQNPQGFVLDARVTEPITVLVKTGKAYTLTLTREGTDDYGDEPELATPLTLPASITGRLQSGADIDVFSVELEAGASYHLTSTNSSTSVYVRAPDGASLRDTFTVPETGTYFLYVHTASLSPQREFWGFTLSRQ
ncbi:PPC domain-containing protein [Pyxidicoccus sp. 3LFB2]